jgi:small-conductance mechanosensitive channel
VKVGDVITLGDTEGQIETISIRSTTVRTRSYIDILIPNKRLITEEVTNWTYGDHVVMVDVHVGVSYDSDIKLVRDILLDVAENHGLVLDKPAPVVRFDDFGESSLDFTLRCAISDPMERPRIQSDLRFAIRSRFRKASVEIPFPQRDLHLRSSAIDVGMSKAAVPAAPAEPKLPSAT